MTSYKLSVAVLLLIILQSPVAAQQYSTSEFEAFLIPVTATNARGAYGSVWTTELWYRNNSAYPVKVLGTADVSSPPNSNGVTERLRLLPMSPNQPGTFLLVTKLGSEDVQFDLRLFNVADPDDTVGTKIPVVRATEFEEQVNLINVPTGLHMRSALRVYVHPNDYWIAGDTVTLTVYSNDERLLATAEIPLRGTPKYGAILSLTETFPHIIDDRVRLHIKSQNDVRLWAFVATVSNLSQRVSVVTPD